MFGELLMAIKRQSVDLGFILKGIPNSDFDMSNFAGRLRFQKIIYIIQAFGTYLGYDFSWYIRGPYCSTLAATGFSLSSFYDRIDDNPDVKFVDKTTQKDFETSKKFLRKFTTNDDLEIAASLHILKHTTNKTKSEIIHIVSTEKPKKFKPAECERIWNMLEKSGIMK